MQGSPGAEPGHCKPRAAAPCCWVPPLPQHTATAARRKHFASQMGLGRKKKKPSLFILGLPFLSFGKPVGTFCRKEMVPEMWSAGESLWWCLAGLWLTWFSLCFQIDPSHPIPLLLCVFACNTVGDGPTVLLNSCGPLSTMLFCMLLHLWMQSRGSSETALSHLGGCDWKLLASKTCGNLIQKGIEG